MSNSSDQSGRRGTVQVHLRELSQLFNSMDPSPFLERDLDPDAEEFIIESARELPHDLPLAIDIVLDRDPPDPDAHAVAAEAIQSHFRRLSGAVGSQLRQLFREGRISLAIGLSCVIGAVAGGEGILWVMGEGPTGTVIRESLIIGGWVAMWRPMEIFLYDWWPIQGRRRLFDRLGVSEVRIIPARPA